LPVRIVFIILILATSLWVIPVYLLVWILFPEARTAEQKLQMHGEPITVENIGKTVAAEVERLDGKEKSGYIGGLIEAIGGFLKVCFIGLSFLIGIPLLFTIVILLALLIGIGGGLAGLLPLGLYGNSAFLMVSNPTLATITFIILLLVPLIALIYGIIAYFANPKPLNKSVKWGGLLIWILALILFFCSGFRINKNWEYEDNNAYRWSWNRHDAIKGNGIFAEKQYTLEPVNYISIEKGIVAHLQIEQVSDDSVSLLISGDENLTGKIQHKINNGKLRLFTYNNLHFKRRNNLIIRLQVPSLRGIKVESIGDISINGTFVGDELRIELEGAGKFQADSLTVQILKVDSEGIGSVKLGGYARKATLDVEGVGGIDAGNLLSDTVYANVDGVASIRCNPTEYLKGGVNGVGSIKYKNEPKEKDTWLFGAGSVGKE
jgi:phage shock protein PspC (stress-responsive transcriptional regulator)